MFQTAPKILRLSQPFIIFFEGVFGRMLRTACPMRPELRRRKDPLS